MISLQNLHNENYMSLMKRPGSPAGSWPNKHGITITSLPSVSTAGGSGMGQSLAVYEPRTRVQTEPASKISAKLSFETRLCCAFMPRVYLQTRRGIEDSVGPRCLALSPNPAIIVHMNKLPRNESKKDSPVSCQSILTKYLFAYCGFSCMPSIL